MATGGRGGGRGPSFGTGERSPAPAGGGGAPLSAGPGTLPPFGRFIIVGAGSTAIGFIIFRISMYLLPPFAFKTGSAQSICYLCGALWSFFWNRLWTFESKAPVARQGMKFFLVQGFMLALTSAYMWLAVDLMKGPENLNWLIVTALATFLNYALLKHFAFKQPKAD